MEQVNRFSKELEEGVKSIPVLYPALYFQTLSTDLSMSDGQTDMVSPRTRKKKKTHTCTHTHHILLHSVNFSKKCVKVSMHPRTCSGVITCSMSGHRAEHDRTVVEQCYSQLLLSEVSMLGIHQQFLGELRILMSQENLHSVQIYFTNF